MVDFKEINKTVRTVSKSLKSRVHRSGKPRIGSRSMEDFIEEEEKRTGIRTPKIIRTKLLGYGTHRLNFRILDNTKDNRYLFGRGVMHGTFMYDWGDFDRISYFEHNKEYYLPIPLQNAYLLEDLYYGQYILLQTKEGAQNEEDVNLFLYEYPDRFTPLNVTLEQYFELLPKTFGMYCWQSYLTPESYPLDGAIPDHFHVNMQQLFPSTDLSIFRQAPPLEDSVYNRYCASEIQKDYRGLFIEMMAKLEAHPHIKFRYYERTEGHLADKTMYTARYGVTEDVLRKIKKDYGREISPQMIAFYYQMNGCMVNWVYQNPDDDTYIEGKINFLPLEETMGGKWHKEYLDWKSPNLFRDEDAVYYFNEQEAAEHPALAELMQRARIFDEQGEMRDYFIEFIEGQEEPNIYKVVRTDFYLMNIDFITFIEARIEFAGISGWEYKFYESDYSAEAITRFTNEFKEQVLKILPSADFERFGL